MQTLLKMASLCCFLTRGEYLCFTARTGRALLKCSKWLLHIRKMRSWVVIFFFVFFSLLHVFLFCFLWFLFLKCAMLKQRKNNVYAPSPYVCPSASGSAGPDHRCPADVAVRSESCPGGHLSSRPCRVLCPPETCARCLLVCPGLTVSGCSVNFWMPGSPSARGHARVSANCSLCLNAGRRFVQFFVLSGQHPFPFCLPRGHQLT